jgi:hypothetical protein
MAISRAPRPLGPFLLDDTAQTLLDCYPEAGDFLGIAKVLAYRDQEAIARLWLSEGIPYGFRDRPILYEALRGWLAQRLRVHAKEITVIGSTRIGFSLAPPPDLGKSFMEESDLDFSVVSAKLFQEVVASFEMWAADFEAGRVHPRGPAEERNWRSNLSFGRRNIPRGFMDPWKIPQWQRYPTSTRIAQAMWALGRKLQLTKGVSKAPKTSVRVYQDWSAFVRRITFNLRVALGQER